MTEAKLQRINKVAKELNVGIETIVDFLKKKRYNVENNPNAKISPEMYNELLKEFSSDSNLKKKSDLIDISTEKTRSITIEDVNSSKEQMSIEKEKEEEDDDEEMILIKPVLQGPKVLGKIDLNQKPQKAKEEKPEPIQQKVETQNKEVDKKKESKVSQEPELTKTEIPQLTGPKVLSKINIDEKTNRNGKSTKKLKDKKSSKKEKSQTPVDEIKAPIVTDNIELPIEELSISESSIEIIPEEIYRTEIKKIDGPKVVDKIDLAQFAQKPSQKPKENHPHQHHRPDKKKTQLPKEQQKPVFSTSTEKEKVADNNSDKRHKRKRIIPKTQGTTTTPQNNTQPKTDLSVKKPFSKKDKKKKHRFEVDVEEVDRSVKSTIASMLNKTKSQTSKYRKEKRDAFSQKMQDELELQEKEKNIIKITEFVSVNELSSLMNVPVNEVISTCMNLGLFVSINQRLDADTITVIADEFGFKTEFIAVDVQTDYEDSQEDNPDDIESRPSIVTVMGHVDHGKTKLLDYIRNTNVVAGEAGGITQHIGAYHVKLDNGRQITFLDTPGHEAFTAMRARGAQVTDIAIIVIAADDGIKPQTIEAINHAQAAGVPMIFAINKIDKQGANPDKIREQLSNMNILVEEWGGKFQSQEIAAKQGQNVDLLLEKILLETDMLELKANPKRRASGVIIESSLDKGKGYVANCLVKNGTLHGGDIILAGTFYGRVKAMFNERNIRLTEAGPSSPVQVLGLNGAPQAGDKFNVLISEQEAKDIATKRAQIIREQGLRTQKHITLEELGRRLKVGNFKELNIIVKGDVDGSIEALSDSLIKLSNEEIQVNVIHKAVGQISESDVMLAAASEAIIIGFQVRPSFGARKIAEQEQIEIRLYSIIYDAIEEIKLAMEGMLSPVIKEEILGSAEVKEIFNIGKVGTIAGCFVHEGKIVRTAKVRLIRDGIVTYSGELSTLKRFKDDAKEVTSGLECGLSIDKFNDIKIGDVVEAFTETETKKKL